MKPREPHRETFLVFGAPAIEETEIAEVVSCLRSGWLGTGPRAARFEEDFRAYKRAAHAAAVSSCTAALHLSLLAAGIGPGDEVITSAMTFCATVNAIVHAGAIPVLADIEPATMNLDPGQVKRHLNARTRAIVPVHFAGRPCDMDSLLNIAGNHGLKVIEDCAHAIETEYQQRKSGTMGDFGCFSFYVTKNITTAEGGMVLARQKEDAEKIKMLALHGLSQDAWSRFSDEGYRHYYVQDCGFKYNMTDLQAALGIHQLARVARNWHRRHQIWQRYQKELSGLPITLPAEPEPMTRHGYHLYTILIEDAAGIRRDDFLEAMTRFRIGVGVHYLSIPEHPYYQQRFGWRPSDFPQAMNVGRRTVSLPLSAGLTDQDVADVISAVRSILKGRDV
jgi:dTDP-4-amino-4,6-dideoxygalactose transaminase